MNDLSNLNGKRILLGVTGSIAAYKAADLCSQLGKAGADVHVILTHSARQFVGTATFQALTRNPVLCDLFDEPFSRRITHIDLAQSADGVLIAPATGNIVAKMAHGIADDLLTACLLAVPPTTPLLVAPAMNPVMLSHPATAANLTTLRSRGVMVIDPEYGMLACQDIGTGKLAGTDQLLCALIHALTPAGDLAGVQFLVTAGATREPIDPVRFLSNRSSGRMGYAVAAAALALGARVTLVAGSTSVEPPAGTELIKIDSAAEMYDAVMGRIADCDVFVGAAAVADFTPLKALPHKMKKRAESTGAETSPLTLQLVRTKDILAEVGARKSPVQIVVGFAAETENLIANAAEKLATKRADLIVANDVTAEGAGFDVDSNIVTILDEAGAESLPLMSKQRVAERIAARIIALRKERSL